MKKTVLKVKQAVSILLAAVIVMVSLPQAGISASASELMAAEDRALTDGDADMESTDMDSSGPEETDTGNSDNEDVAFDDAGMEDTDTENPDTENTDTENAYADKEDAEDTDTDETEGTDTNDTDTDYTDINSDDAQETNTGNADSENVGMENGVTTEAGIEKAGKNYLIDDTLGFTLTDANMEPGSYSAKFSARLNKYVSYQNQLAVLYTTDEERADDFFPDMTNITAASLSDGSNAGFQVQIMTNYLQTTQRDSEGNTYISFTVDFAGNTVLTPDTVYYYRIACYNLDSSAYYFLTVPGQFTTGSRIENSSVKIASLEAETISYHAAKIVWTVENPNNEYIKEHYVKDTGTGGSYYPSNYIDANGDTIFGKYYVIISSQNKTINIQPVLKVYTGEGELTDISSDASLDVALKDINDADITLNPIPGYASFQSQVQISPWYEMVKSNGDASPYGDQFYIGMFYRAKGEALWQASPVYSITSENTTITLCSGLSPETAYEYYIKLAEDYSLTNCICSYGSEDRPESFFTKEIESYEDSQFPDEVFRSYIKNSIGISDEEKITSDKLETLSAISLYHSNGNPVVKSLDGIQYIPHLSRLTLYDHAVTDADIISGLTDLQEINLSYNDLTSLPDLSEMLNLKTADFNKNKITSGIVEEKLPTAFLEANPSWLSDTANNQRIYTQTPGQSQIKAAYAKLPWSTSVANTYAVKPSTTKPFAAGYLSDTSLNNALNLVNFVRYTAGISSDVTLNDAYTSMAQAGTLVLAMNGKLTHTPSKPSASGFPDDLYNLGYTGCSSSNLAMGFNNLADSILRGWMNDGDSSNISAIGHRRWVLNPSMTATGFGAAGSFTSMYAFDRNGPTISDFVAWPARNMPTELGFSSSYPWTVSVGTDYKIPTDRSQVKVTLKNSATGKTWTFNSATSSSSGKYFSINSEGYGQGTCIIFRPKTSEVSYLAGSRFEVSITGLKDKAGDDKELKYTVDFFSVQKNSASITLNKSTLKLSSGDSETLIATTKSTDEDDTTVTWSSSNSDVATVDETGKVTAVAPGDAVITAVFQGKQATCKVLVRDYSLSRSELGFDLADGTITESLTVSDGIAAVKDVTWSSDNAAVASVSKSKSGGSGIVTPKGSGTTQIRAGVKDGPVLVCTVTVTKNVLTSISLNLRECTLEKGASRQLKLYFVPNDTTLSKEAVWRSDHPETVSVDNVGMVTALSKGTAVITAVVGELEAECIVTVIETASPDQGNIPADLKALTNVQTMLSDVSLKEYKGWEWEDGDIPLAQFSGMQKKSFAAVYHEEGYADYKTTLEVSLATLSGISITAPRTTLKQNDEMQVNIQWKMSGSESIMSAYADTLKWGSSNPSVVTVGSTGETILAGTEAALKAGTTLGSANITAQITLGGQNYKASSKVTVVDGIISEFQNLSVEGFTQISQNGASPMSYEGMLESQAGNIRVTVTNTSKLTVKSNNTKVISVGKAKLEEGAYQIPLTLKSAGMAQITLTANDAAKSTMTLLLYVKDAKPNLGQNTVTVNRLQTTGTSFNIYPNDGYLISGYELVGDNASRFERLAQGTENDSFVIKARKDTLKGSYKLSVKVTISEIKTAETDQSAALFEYELPLTVKVTEQLPKYKIKQSAKANLFYRDLGAPQLTVTTKESLNGVILTGCDFKLIEIEKGITYIISPDVEGNLSASPNKKGVLQLAFEGYETISVPYTVKAENKKPKLSLDNKTVVFYPNAEIRSAVINVKSGGQPLAPDSFSAVLKKSGFSLSQTENGLILSDGDFSKAATIKEQMDVTCNNWTTAIPLSFTIKVNMGKPTVKLKKTALQLNADTTAAAYDMAGTEIMWKDGAYFNPDNRLSVSASDDKAQAVINDGIVFEQDGNQIIARLNNKNVAAGSYKFKIQVIGVPNTPASFTVKIVNADLSKAVKLSTKGSIDVLNRKGSYVTVTPSLKSVNGDLTEVKLSGRFAHLFTAKINEKNKIVIYAKDRDDYGRDVALITKYPYSVNLVITLTNAKGETIQLTTAEIRLKLKQGKPKMTAAPKKAVFFSGAYNTMRLDISAALKNGTDLEIKNVELINYTDLFDYSDGTLKRLYTGTAVKGKTYKLQFRITFRNQADNEKAVVVKYNVKIK